MINLTASVGAKALGEEAKNPTVGSQLVGYSDNYGDVVKTLTSYANSVNSSNITYGATSTNSNAFAFGAVRELIGFTPSTEYRAFGSGTVLPVNR